MTTPAVKAHSSPALLVAYTGQPMSEVQLHLACRAANDVGGTVHVLYVLLLGPHLPLHAPLPDDKQAQVDTLLNHAEEVVTRYGVPCQTHLYVARTVGPAIVHAAREIEAREIFLGVRNEGPEARFLLSSTIRHVLKNAPCPVLMAYVPERLAATFPPFSAALPGAQAPAGEP